jgi:urocanate hydratase
VSTQGVVEVEYGEMLALPEIHVSLGVNEMMGYPGYVCAFMRTCELLSRHRSHSVVMKSDSQIKSKVDDARLVEVRYEVNQLLSLLAAAGSGIVTSKLLKRLNEGLVINLVGHPQ